MVGLDMTEFITLFIFNPIQTMLAYDKNDYK